MCKLREPKRAVIIHYLKCVHIAAWLMKGRTCLTRLALYTEQSSNMKRSKKITSEQTSDFPCCKNDEKKKGRQSKIDLKRGKRKKKGK